MAKYDPLRTHLLNDSRSTVEMTFEEIEVLVGALPNSAYLHDWWWAVEPDGSRHVQAAAWRDAQRTTSVDRAARRVTFTQELRGSV